MSDLTAFADHCRRMAAAEHTDDCAAEVPVRSAFWPELTDTVRPDPDCPGCVTDDDRALWARLAAEVDDYLAPQPDLFGGNGPEEAK